jgi:hypothetical protein
MNETEANQLSKAAFIKGAQKKSYRPKEKQILSLNVIEKETKENQILSLNVIEKETKEKQILSLEASKKTIFALRHLEVTGRWKENPVYRKSSFKEYLLGFHNIREDNYRDSFRAFDRFEKETMKYGIGIISKIFRECGTKKERQVLDEIQKAERKLKNPIKKDKIETIIQKYARRNKPRP